jgi:hypothetical protein
VAAAALGMVERLSGGPGVGLGMVARLCGSVGWSGMAARLRGGGESTRLSRKERDRHGGEAQRRRRVDWT